MMPLFSPMPLSCFFLLLLLHFSMPMLLHAAIISLPLFACCFLSLSSPLPYATMPRAPPTGLPLSLLLEDIFSFLLTHFLRYFHDYFRRLLIRFHYFHFCRHDDAAAIAAADADDVTSASYAISCFLLDFRYFMPLAFVAAAIRYFFASCCFDYAFCRCVFRHDVTMLISRFFFIAISPHTDDAFRRRFADAITLSPRHALRFR